MSAWRGNTLSAVASVTAPGAGADVVQIANVPSGTYKVRALITLTGTAETALANLRLREGGNTIGDMPSLSASAGPVEICLDQIEVNPDADDAVDVDIIAIAAATAGAVYTIHLALTRIG
jgi:hypothetical protein